MTTQQLECFIRVADKLNFTKAAQEMFLTTPTVTHYIKRTGCGTFYKNTENGTAYRCRC